MIGVIIGCWCVVIFFTFVWPDVHRCVDDENQCLKIFRQLENNGSLPLLFLISSQTIVSK